MVYKGKKRNRKFQCTPGALPIGNPYEGFVWFLLW